MRARLLPLGAAFIASVTLLPASPTSAQTLAADSTDFLITGMLQQGQQPPASQPAPGQRRGSTAPGIGFGVKGGVLFSSFRGATIDYTNNTGWQGGIFLGGNRPGALGVMTEITYAKKGAKSDYTIDTYYLEIPLLLRMNIGSSNRNSGVLLYFIAGPAADILLKSQVNSLDVKDQFASVDWNVLGGGGIEISRLIIEGRFAWGLAGVLKGPGSELKTQSFAVLGGIRFN